MFQNEQDVLQEQVFQLVILASGCRTSFVRFCILTRLGF